MTLRIHFLIRAQHPLRIDHSLGASGRARSEHNFGNSVWAYSVIRPIYVLGVRATL